MNEWNTNGAQFYEIVLNAKQPLQWKKNPTARGMALIFFFVEEK